MLVQESFLGNAGRVSMETERFSRGNMSGNVYSVLEISWNEIPHGEQSRSNSRALCIYVKRKLRFELSSEYFHSESKSESSAKEAHGIFLSPSISLIDLSCSCTTL